MFLKWERNLELEILKFMDIQTWLLADVGLVEGTSPRRPHPPGD